MNDAIVAMLPCIVKSYTSGGKRLVTVGASTTEVDLDGDVILQQALLGAAPEFIARGHLDLDHKSEFGERMGIPNPSSYIVGRPLEVKDAGNGCTEVVGEISRSRDDSFDPKKNKYDELWASLQSEPPVQWYSSVYGYPIDLDVCKSQDDNPYGARRYIIKSMDWRSLAFTRTPKNTAIKNAARIVSAKSYMSALMRGLDPYASVPPLTVTGMGDLWERRFCIKCAVHEAPTTVGYRRHFEKCAGILPGDADVFAHALMHKVNQVKVAGLK
jgi:hypothetical protein